MEVILFLLWWIVGTAIMLMLCKITGDTYVIDFIICIFAGCVVGPLAIIFLLFAFPAEKGPAWNKKLW